MEQCPKCKYSLEKEKIEEYKPEDKDRSCTMWEWKCINCGWKQRSWKPNRRRN